MTAKHHLSAEAPYSDTKIPYGQTKNEIDEMLKEAGAIAIRWTENEDSMRGVGLPKLEFVLPYTLRGVETRLGIRMEPKLTQKSERKFRNRGYGGRIRSSGPVVHVPNRNGSMRLLYWYLKNRLEAIRFGYGDAVDQLMSHIINELPDGTQTTFGETVKHHPEVIRELLPSFEIVPRRQLEVKNIGSTSVPEAESRVMREVVEVAAELVEEQEKKE